MIGFGEWLQSTPFSIWIQTTSWVIPLLQSIHILTIGIVFVSILMVALRVLGWVRTDEAFGIVLDRFSPWIGGGLIVMALTGLLLVVGEPVRQFAATSFWLKMALLLIGVTSAFAFRHALSPAKLGAACDLNFSARSKAVAVGTVILWLAIIFLGRAIAYDIEVWGPLSLAPRA
jgi:hypothetical protein